MITPALVESGGAGAVLLGFSWLVSTLIKRREDDRRILAWDARKQVKIASLHDELAAIAEVLPGIDDPIERKILTTAFETARTELAALEPGAPPPRPEPYQRTADELKAGTGARTSITLYYCSRCRTAYRRTPDDTKGCPNGCAPVAPVELIAKGVNKNQAFEMLDSYGRQRHPSQVRNRAEPVIDLSPEPPIKVARLTAEHLFPELVKLANIEHDEEQIRMHAQIPTEYWGGAV